MTIFLDALVQEPEDPVLGLSRKFEESPHPQKVNLGVGIYQDESGKSRIFEAVQRAEQFIGELAGEQKKDYLPIEGDPLFLKLASKRILGDMASMDSHGAVQTLGGTGALWLAVHLAKKGGILPLVVFTPTWPNHILILKEEGVKTLFLPYKNEGGFPHDLVEKLPEKSLILLQLACHNPLGKDPKKEDWTELFSIMKKRDIYPLFDNAYQGLGEGVEEDISPAKEWFKKGGMGFMATSFSKNMGLYGERAGMLSYFAKDDEQKRKIASSVKVRIRTTISNPPRHPAEIIKTIMSNRELAVLWENELTSIRLRLHNLRQGLQKALGGGVDVSGKGLFTTLPFSEEAIDRLFEKDGIVMMKNGRINLSGIREDNFDRVTTALCREIKRAS